MAEIVEGTLAQQLAATRKDVRELTDAVRDLARRDWRRRVETAVLAVLLVGTAALGAIFFLDDRHDDRTARAAARNAYLISCEAANDSRQLQRMDNIADGELLIQITGAEARDPDLVAAYRRGIAAQNEKLKDRDCLAELRSIERGDT